MLPAMTDLYIDACCREVARLMHRADWQGRRANGGIAFAWFDWDRNHRRPLARHLPQYYRRRQRRLGTGISTTTTAVSEAVTTVSAIAIELLKAAS